MLELLDVMRQEHCITGYKANSKKQLLMQLSAIASESLFGVLSAQHICESVMAQEAEHGSNASHGIWMPNARIAAYPKTQAFCAVLREPLDCDAADGIDADIVFMVLSPQHASGEHLQAMAKASRFLRDKRTARSMRGCKTPEAAYMLFMQALEEAA